MAPDADALTEAFANAWRRARMGENDPEQPPPEAAAAVRDLVTAGQSAWPDLPVDAVALAAHIGALTASDITDVTKAPGVTHAADLHLAFACASGVTGALAAFDRTCAVAIDATIARVFRSPTFRDEVRQALHKRLFVGGDGVPPRILTYAGRGPLAAWVAISTKRVALSMQEAEATRARIEDEAAAEGPDIEGDPELRYLKQRYQGAFKAAFRVALRQLPEDQRTLLRLNVVEGMTLDRMGVMFGVNASTVSRWLEKARDAIREATQAELGRNLDVSPAEFASLARLVVSQLDVSIAALFDVRVQRS